MSVIDAEMLIQMRADVAEMLPDTCVIYTPGYSPDGAGGGTVTLTNSGTVACRVDPLKQQQQAGVDFGQETMEVGYQLTVPYDASLAPDYQIITWGKTYQVKKLAVDHSWRVSRRAEVVEVR